MRRRKSQRFILSGMLVALFAGIPASATPPVKKTHSVLRSPELLYREGKGNEARKLYLSLLTKAESSQNKQQIWNLLHRFAWFENEVGEYEHAILLANRAFEIASELRHPFMIGRSLDWLGWSYAAQGYYEVAIELYDQAAEIGKRGGKIVQPAVWGLATQELGATYYKMGDVRKAKELLNETIAFARKFDITVGIAEGGAELSEIVLAEGDYAEASKLAREAVQAAKDCGCSPFNTARAKYVLAKALYTIHHKGGGEEQYIPFIKEAIDQASRTGNVRYVAEGKLLLSKALADSEREKKELLIDEALEELYRIKSESRGVAELERARFFIESNRESLAGFYLERGIEINQQMFRNVDNAYISELQAAVSRLQKDDQMQLEHLRGALDRALETGKTLKAAELSSSIAFRCQRLGFDALALKYGKKSLALHEQLINAEEDDDHLQVLQDERLKLKSLLVQLEAESVPRAHRAPGA